MRSEIFTRKKSFHIEKLSITFDSDRGKMRKNIGKENSPYSLSKFWAMSSKNTMFGIHFHLQDFYL